MIAGADPERYVYALAGRGLPQKLRVLGRTLRTIAIGDVAVVVEDRAPRMQPTTDGLRQQHEIVVNLADRVDALLPARFGSRIGEATLRSIVNDHRAKIQEALSLVRGRRQMTIRVFGTPEGTTPGARPESTGTEFLRALRERARHVPPEVSIVRDVIGDLAAAEIVEPGERGLRVTLFHLVAVDMTEAYRDRASVLEVSLAPHRVTITGP